MPVYIDHAYLPFGRMKMCHMIADTLEELHQMALAIGMKIDWFQPTSFPHYDVCKKRRSKALELGAIEVTRKELALHMRRLRKRKESVEPEKHMASVEGSASSSQDDP